MRHFSFWPVLVVLLLGVLVLREPRFEKLEENFLRWLLRNAQPPQRIHSAYGRGDRSGQDVAEPEKFCR